MSWLNLKQFLDSYKLIVKSRGILHLGANRCQEKDIYTQLVPINKVLWVEAIPSIVRDMQVADASLRIFQGVISDIDNQDIDFYISSNDGQSSSFLELGLHREYYPWVTYVNMMELVTVTVDTFLERHMIAPHHINILVMDLQGAELLALKGANKLLPFIDCIHLEVNSVEIYEGCALFYQIEQWLDNKNFYLAHHQIEDGKVEEAFYLKKTA